MCVAFFLITALSIKLVDDYLYDQKLGEERRVAANISPPAAELLEAGEVDALRALIASHGAAADVRILILDGQGVVVADSLDALIGVPLITDEILGVIGGQQSAFAVYNDGIPSYGLGGATAIYAEAVNPYGTRLGATVIVAGVQDIQDGLARIRLRIQALLIVVTLLALTFSILTSRMLTTPIKALRVGIDKMTRGDFSYRLKIAGHSEFAQLADAFNMMCDRLENLDKSRNQFVSNASHELKTPLSTMKILIETLMYQEGFDPEVQKEFLSDINKEIDRLNLIISDLLVLVKIDSESTASKHEPVSLNDIMIETLNSLSPLARERGIELDMSGRDTLSIDGNRGQLSQVFYNLLDNAIKYTPRGGSVRVEISKSGKRAIIKVIDTGIGIAKSEQIHIFDRFYRVDRARARDTGGTGLGLSIVKQYIAAHGGSVTVSSEENRGSTFTVELPLIST